MIVLKQVGSTRSQPMSAADSADYNFASALNSVVPLPQPSVEMSTSRVAQLAQELQQKQQVGCMHLPSHLPVLRQDIPTKSCGLLLAQKIRLHNLAAGMSIKCLRRSVQMQVCSCHHASLVAACGLTAGCCLAARGTIFYGQPAVSSKSTQKRTGNAIWEPAYVSECQYPNAEPLPRCYVSTPTGEAPHPY